jgi:hypothetical protein
MNNSYVEVRERVEEALFKLAALSDLISVCHNPQELGAETLGGLALLINDVSQNITEACIPLYRAPQTPAA